MSKFLRLSIASVAVVAMFQLTSDCHAQRQRGNSADVWAFISEKYDKNNDGKLTKTEYDRADNFERFDQNKDGVLTKEDWASGSPRRSRNQGAASAPSQGDQAPDFELTSITDPTKKVRLSSFAGEKPVALIFGSCT